MRERTNEQWLAELRRPNSGKALADLYDLLVRGLKAALGSYEGGVEANVGDFAQEALIKITGNLDSFRGEPLHHLGPEDRHERSPHRAQAQA
jgi:DNA-directed RNA polymerase specialized sigma24 family protein